MSATPLRKLSLLIGFASSILHAQEKPAILLAPDALVKKYETEFKKTANTKLLAFASSVGKNPLYFLENVSAFYNQTCQSSENRTWQAYLQSPKLNFCKSLAYLTLSRKINEQVYTPENLATEIDHQALVQTAATLFAQEWAFYSVQMDLDAHTSQLESLKSLFENEKQKLALAEQNDRNLKSFATKLTRARESLNRASHAIRHRKTIREISSNPLSSIINAIQKNSLKEMLTKLRVAFPVKEINNYFKAYDSGLTLIQALCLSQALTTNQKQNGITNLLSQEDVLINEQNLQGKKVLDLILKSDPLYGFLLKNGAERSAQNSAFKKTYDTPPSTPDNTSEVKVKKVSFLITHTENKVA